MWMRMLEGRLGRWVLFEGCGVESRAVRWFDERLVFIRLPRCWGIPADNDENSKPMGCVPTG